MKLFKKAKLKVHLSSLTYSKTVKNYTIRSDPTAAQFFIHRVFLPDLHMT